MMELAGGLTDTGAVLTCAGLSPGDVSHQRLLESGIEDDLILHLYTQVPNYEALVAAGVGPAASDLDRNLTRAIKNYARWYCAQLLAGRWALYKQLVSDGKSRNDRFDRMDFAAMQANVRAQFDNAWAMLVALQETGQPSVELPVPTLFSKSTPAYNPVTDIET